MEWTKGVLRRIFCLSLWPTVLICVPSYAFVFMVLCLEGVHPALQYAAYALSAYALVLTVTGTVRAVRLLRTAVDGKREAAMANAHPLLKRYAQDKLFRAEVGLYRSAAINFAYIFLKLFMGLYYRSDWFVSLSAYYLLLVVTRFSLMRYLRGSRPGENLRAELVRYRLCGIFLLVVNIALSGIVTLVVLRGESFHYRGYLIYIMAMYSFYCVISGVLNIKKFRGYNSPVLSASKAVSLTTALVSMLALETAMISQFSDEAEEFRFTMTAVTGFVVCVFVLGMAAYMIITATNRLRAIDAPAGTKSEE